VITCHCSFTISSNGPQPPSPSALPSVAQSYTGSMVQAVASARRWTNPMAGLFPTTTIVFRPFPTSLPCFPTILRLDHTNLPFAIQLLLLPLLQLLLHPITLVFKTTSCPFPLKRISQLPCKPFGTVRCGDWYWPWDFSKKARMPNWDVATSHCPGTALNAWPCSAICSPSGITSDKNNKPKMQPFIWNNQ
jgi:hypothetical protein